MFTKINCANYKHLLHNKIAQLDLIPTVLVRLFFKATMGWLGHIRLKNF